MLNIFISHKMPTDTRLANDIGQKLALYAGNQVRVTHAGKFRYGEDWRRKIQEELNQANWLIFLSTDPDDDWGFCLFECGFFRKIMEANPDRKLITFCRNPDAINDALKEFNAVPISQPAVRRLLGDIYVDPPWQVKPDLDPSIMDGTAKEIVDLFTGVERVEKNFDVAPSVIMEMIVTDKEHEELRDGRLPPETQISGTRDWQRLFGRDIDTGAWLWKDLTEPWPFAEVYEYLIAKMICDALDSHMPSGTFLRAADSSDTLHRLTLRRYELMKGGKYRFHFTAAPFDLPFDPPQPGERLEENLLYHLVNISWYFQRRVVEQVYERLLEISTMKPSDRPQAVLDEIYDTIGRELVQIRAQAIIRGLDNPRVVTKLLDANNPSIKKLLTEMESASELRKQVFEAMKQGAYGLPAISANLYKMAMLNYQFYQVFAESYAQIAKTLPVPPAPLERKETN